MQQVLMTDDRRGDLPRHIADLAPCATDLHLVCRDGKVRGHQAVLSWASSVLRRLLMSSLLLEDGGKRKEEATFLLPDVSTEAVTFLLSFLLTGALHIRASKRLRDEIEEVWDLLSIDRISFKSVFEAGVVELKSGGPNMGVVQERKSDPKQPVRAFKTPMKPKRCPPGPPDGGQQHQGVQQVIAAPPLAASTPLVQLPRTLAIKKIPHNLLINANVSITREGVGEALGEKVDVEIIEVAKPAKKNDSRVGQKGVPGRTPHFAKAKRNISMVYSKTRPGVKSGVLRQKLSQRPGGIFKRTTLQERGKIVKVKGNLAMQASSAETAAVRKSLRSKPRQVVYSEEELEKNSFRRNCEEKAAEKADSGRKSDVVGIDDAQEQQIKDKMMSSRSPKLRIPIKKLLHPNKHKPANKSTSPAIKVMPYKTGTPTPETKDPTPKKNTVSITRMPSTPAPSQPSESELRMQTETTSLSTAPPKSIPKTPCKVISLGTPPPPSLALTPKMNTTLTVAPKSVLKSTPEMNKKNPKSALKPSVAPGELKSALKIGKSPPETTPEPKSALKTPGSALKTNLKSAMKPAAPSPSIPSTSSPSVLGHNTGLLPVSNAHVQPSQKSLASKDQRPNNIVIKSTNIPTSTIGRPTTGDSKNKASPIGLVVEEKSLNKAIKRGASSKPMTVTISKSGEGASKSNGEVTCYICRQSQDEEGRRLSLDNVFFVRSHLSKCLYNSGKLFQSIPPGKNNTDLNGAPIDELGNKTNSWYNCQVEGCWLAQKKGQAGQVCYKVFAIHMASQHGALEMVMLEEGGEAREIVELLMTNEEEKRQGVNQLKQEVPDQVMVEESVGPPPLMKKHLAALDALFPPPARSGSDSRTPQALLTQTKNTGTSNSGCLNSTFQIPTSPAYTVLPSVSSMKTSVITPLSSHMSATTLKTREAVKCRFQNCDGPGGGAGGNPREMKLHYAGRHFSKYFQVDPTTKLPPGFTRAGNRAVCIKCTESSVKPVYVQCEESAVRGHLVVKHDSLGEILLQAADVTEAHQVIADLYPELLEWTATN